MKTGEGYCRLDEVWFNEQCSVLTQEEYDKRIQREMPVVNADADVPKKQSVISTEAITDSAQKKRGGKQGRFLRGAWGDKAAI
ncbi:hypothetical protein DCCM_3227 [Desulfocucumis palustris]|uniref:Uncharacterized protein n=1 Tax=Desulfocucumis palustris TaxID=1898651 RepID=A0A2L2XD15_9FIRM|nr:hypothetical protein DCCM_3227 [Desulfocucumis palustris]